MKRYTFQVNMHFGDREVSAIALHNMWHKCGVRTPTVYAPTLPAVLRKIKNKIGLKLEEITLEFQPE